MIFLVHLDLILEDILIRVSKRYLNRKNLIHCRETATSSKFSALKYTSDFLQKILVFCLSQLRHLKHRIALSQ